MCYRPNQKIDELSRIIEKGIKDSKAISTRALCILATVYVWSLDINIHIVDDCGCVIDAAMYAAFTALIHFRRPRTSVVSDQLIIVCMYIYILFSLLNNYYL